MAGKKKLALHWKILIGMFAGVIWSVIITGAFGGIETESLKSDTFSVNTETNAVLITDDVKAGDLVFTIGSEEIKPERISRNEQGIKAKFKTSDISNIAVAKSKKGSFLVWLTDFTQDWIKPWGDIFIRILKFIAVPLVMFSIIIGVSGLKNISKLRRMGLKTLGMYLLTTVFAVGVGLTVVNLMQPGKSIAKNDRIKKRIQYELWAQDNALEIKDDVRLLESTDPEILELKEEAIIEANASVDASVQDKLANANKAKEEGPLQKVVEMVPSNLIAAFQNPKLMLQVIFFAIFFGICMAILPEDKMKPVRNFFDGVNEVFLKMVDYAMKAAPFFVFCLMAGVIGKMADTPTQLLDLLLSLGMYALVVLVGLIIMLIIYPLIASLFVKNLSFGSYVKRILPAQMTAFSTSSSAATLPVTLECVEDRIGVSDEVSSFVLPVGATVNMDGTSLYQAVAVIFLAQMHMIDLSISEQLIIVLTATLASIGSAAVPSAGLVMLMIVLQSVELNPLWIAIILPVDRILDMCRTVVNVTGDATVATIIGKSENALELKHDFE